MTLTVSAIAESLGVPEQRIAEELAAIGIHVTDYNAPFSPRQRRQIQLAIQEAK